MKKLIIYIMTLLMLISIVSCEKPPKANPAKISAAMGSVSSVNELFARTDAVVIGTIKSQESIGSVGEKNDASREWKTRSTMLVEEVIAGNLKKGDKVIISQNGDNIHQVYNYIEETGGLYKKGEKLLIFLCLRLDMKKEMEKKFNKPLAYIASSWNESIFTVDDNGNITPRNQGKKSRFFPEWKSLKTIDRKLIQTKFNETREQNKKFNTPIDMDSFDKEMNAKYEAREKEIARRLALENEKIEQEVEKIKREAGPEMTLEVQEKYRKVFKSKEEQRIRKEVESEFSQKEALESEQSASKP